MDNMRIAVVDDDPDVLRSLARLLHVHGMAPMTYQSAESLLGEIADAKPACIVADLAMPDIDGLELQRTLESAGLDFPIVFVTAQDDVRASVEAMRHGAVDFIEKPFAEGELLDAVWRALERRRARLKDNAGAETYHQRLASLTIRERDVLACVVEGLMNKQIAVKLGIAEKTVKIHRGRIMRKMSVRSVAELARLTERFGLSRSH